MATFISLVNFTQQGIRDFKDSPDRAAKFKLMAEKVGVKVKEVYWTMGVHDVVLILEAPDDEEVKPAQDAAHSKLRFRPLKQPKTWVEKVLRITALPVYTSSSILPPTVHIAYTQTWHP